jgi:hypothetical protein
MSTTVIQIDAEGAHRAAKPFEVLIVEGETIEFSPDGGAGTVLSLTRETAAILSPAPSSLLVEIGGGASFTFLEPTARSYACQVLPDGAEAIPIQTPPPGDFAVLTILASDVRGLNSKTGRGL